MNRRSHPRQNQLDPNRVASRNVQFWSNGVMRTAQLSNDDARQMVANGSAFVISSQAVGALSQDGRCNS